MAARPAPASQPPDRESDGAARWHRGAAGRNVPLHLQSMYPQRQQFRLQQPRPAAVALELGGKGRHLQPGYLPKQVHGQEGRIAGQRLGTDFEHQQPRQRLQSQHVVQQEIVNHGVARRDCGVEQIEGDVGGLAQQRVDDVVTDASLEARTAQADNGRRRRGLPQGAAGLGSVGEAYLGAEVIEYQAADQLRQRGQPCQPEEGTPTVSVPVSSPYRPRDFTVSWNAPRHGRNLPATAMAEMPLTGESLPASPECHNTILRRVPALPAVDNRGRTLDN